jgi:lipopolysaccharide transport system ATP-binding protein
MKEIKNQGKTMVFVSHSRSAVQNICSRVIWLDHGKIRVEGPPQDVVSEYLHFQYSRQQDVLTLKDGEALDNFGTGNIELKKIKILDEVGEPFQTIPGGAGLKIEIHYDAKQQLNCPNIQIYLTDPHEYRVMGSNLLRSNSRDQQTIPKGEGVISCTFDTIPDRPDIYHFNVDILEENELVYRKKGIGPLIIRPGHTAIRNEDYNLFDMDCRWELNGH